MLRLQTITMRNFLSVGAVPQTIDLASAPLTLMLGLNGAGKTTLLQAISFCIFDEPLTKIKKDNLVNNINGKTMELTLDFICNDIVYRIERGRKPMYLRFYVDGVDHAVPGSKTQLEIERIVGMSHTMFQHIVALNTFTTPFLKMKAAEQRELIEELMGITLLSELAVQLKQQMDDHKDSMRDEEAMIKANQQANERIEQAIKTAKLQATDWDIRQTTVRDRLQTRLAEMDQIDIPAELALFDQIDAWAQLTTACQNDIRLAESVIDTIDSKLSRLKYDLAHLDTARGSDEIQRLTIQVGRLHKEAGQSITSQLDRLYAEIKRQQMTIKVKQESIDLEMVAYQAVTDQLASPDAHHCVTCGQGLSGTDHLASVIASLEKTQRQTLNKIDQYHADIKRLNTEIETIEQEIVTLTEQHETKQTALREQALAIETNIVGLQEQAVVRQTEIVERSVQLQAEIISTEEELETQRCRRLELRTTLKNYGDEPRSKWKSRDALWQLQQEREKIALQLDSETSKSNPVHDTIAGLTRTLHAIDYTKLNALLYELKHEQFLYKLLTSKDSFIRKRIIDQSLPYLNRCFDRYLERLGLPHEARLLPDLTTEILLKGRDYDFEQMSRGEMNRVNMATSFSFRDLWQNLNQPVNLFAVDECLDQGNDSSGVETAVTVLQTMAAERDRNVFLISHREELKNQIDTVIYVEKQADFTEFVLE